MGKLTPEQKDYLLEEIDKTDFGTVSIELNDVKNNVEIITTKKRRFEKPKSQPRAGMPVRRNG